MNGYPTVSDAKRYARELQRDKQFEPDIERFDARSQMKVYGLNFLTVLSFVAFVLAKQPLWLVLPLICLNGALTLPYLRVFIHSEAHWGLAKGRIGRLYMRYIAYSFYHIPFEAYRVGHFAHHQYDNDAPGDGESLSRDRQSTYLYSREGIPVRFGIWALYYLFVYQFVNQVSMVVRRSRKQELWEMAAQTVVIMALDLAMILISWKFFVLIFIPSLAVAWIGSAIVLYMMHNVKLTDARYHHSVNSCSRFFNSFGDNVGMHIVHSLAPSLHPYHQARVNKLVEANLHPSQTVGRHYVIAFFADLLFKKKSSALSA